MAVTGFTPDTQPAHLQEAVTVTGVTGAPDDASWYESEVINSEFDRALTMSLAAQGWLQSPGQARYHLDADIQAQETAIRGLDAEAWITTRYILTQATDAVPVYDHTIRSGFLVPHGVAFTGVEKMRLALEGAAQENIAKLLQGLATLPQQSN